MTPADPQFHANTVREALTRRGTGSFQFPPNEALAALDALQTQAETAAMWKNRAMILGKVSQEKVAAEAERDHARDALRQIIDLPVHQDPVHIARAALEDKP